MLKEFICYENLIFFERIDYNIKELTKIKQINIEKIYAIEKTKYSILDKHGFHKLIDCWNFIFPKTDYRSKHYISSDEDIFQKIDKNRYSEFNNILVMTDKIIVKEDNFIELEGDIIVEI
jgi:hypothetical protein